MMPERTLRFTQEARQVLSLAEQVAARLHHPHIRNEHVFLALLQERHGMAGRVLRDLGVDTERSFEVIQNHPNIMKRGRHPMDEPDLALELKRTLVAALKQAHQLGHPHAGTDSLLLALTAGHDPLIEDLFTEFGFKPEIIKLIVLSELGVIEWHYSVPSGLSTEQDELLYYTHHAFDLWELAEQAALGMAHSTVGNQHLLVALAHNEGCVAGRVLRELGVEYGGVVFVVRTQPPVLTDQLAHTWELKPSPELIQSRKRAREEARQLRHLSIGTGHLLLALTRSEDPVLGNIFDALNLTPEGIRQAVLNAFED